MQEEEFYMGTNKQQVKRRRNFNLKIVIIITVSFFVIGLAFIMYKRTFINFDEFDANILDAKDVSVKAMTPEDAGIIETNIQTYIEEQIANSTIKIESNKINLTDKSFELYDLKIYDDETYVLYKVEEKSKNRKTTYEIGKVNIDFNEFETMFFQNNEIITVNLNDDNHGITYPDGITYYTQESFNLIPINTNNYNILEEKINSCEFLCQRKGEVKS